MQLQTQMLRVDKARMSLSFLTGESLQHVRNFHTFKWASSINNYYSLSSTIHSLNVTRLNI